MINLSTEKTQYCCSDNRFQKQQEAISQKEIVFRFRKDIHFFSIFSILLV